MEGEEPAEVDALGGGSGGWEEEEEEEGEGRLDVGLEGREGAVPP